MRSTEAFFKVLVFGVVITYLWIAPYTKVEESFNLQAIHDILNYGIFPSSQIELYDHKSFPGVVPRTFIGSLLISTAAMPIIKGLQFFGINLLEGDQSNLQLLVRLLIGVANVHSFNNLATSVNKIDFQARKNKRPSHIGTCYLLLLLSQFHILFYASRPLPNFIALPFFNFGLSKIVRGNMAGLTWLAFIGIVFRLEIGVLGFIAAIVFSLVFGQSNVFTNLILLAFGTFFGAALSFLVDSHFWGYNVIPELSAFVFNVVEGKSADWGVEPYAAYFKKYIPQLFSPPVVLLLLPLGLLSDPSDDGLVVLDDHKQVIHRPSWNSLRALFISAILFVAVMSIQPHKEWRFIIYIVPALTLVAGYGISSLVDKSLTSWSRRVTVFVMVAFVGVSFISSCSKAYISSFNYPGGEALRLVNQLAVNSNSSKQILIHLDVPTCMTGASRFGELHNQRVVYDKTEDPSELNKIWEHIDFLVTEVRVNDPVWEKAASVQKFSQISLYPVVSLFQQHPTKEKLVKHLANTFVDSFKTMDFSAFKEFVDSAVLKTDYIYIYRRINSEPGEPIAETYSKIEELEEPDMEEVKEQINEQIDELEQ